MDINSLKLFIALSRHLHFGKTSEEMHMSPSAVSRSIQRLEDQLGHALLVRDNRSAQLTEAGQIFLEYALEVVKRYESLQRDLEGKSDVLRGQLSLFASVTASQSILPKVLTDFRQRYPEIHIQLETGYAVNALSKLSEGIDVVVAALPYGEETDDQLRKKIITSIPLQTVAPATGEFDGVLKSTSVNWAEVPLILPSTGQVRQNIDAWLRVNNIVPDVYAEVPGNEAILSLVALGCGVGFVPELVVKESPLADQAMIVEDGPELEDFHVGFCTRQKNLDVSPIIRAFWESIRAD
ncbi:MAG: HTH-type transcriptional activator IlvY [Pseudomonadales bacterium]|nr:HTH-type transcriptional activator IlvY [Pseudomonadales bacterium]MBO6564980.1 HTH-type transcriptional activator IlvY [Pseudomonadales bacterium]MBO6595617.1 HTH-type transcriptional activator IlvY [Pseudomonadales bacterium]MBO6655686.1 HTH-type transcriptional activator IlvY [Pseudomonadales bacterium]MBO6702117.1 HTH-type transcriptional activator IlvY [Pseudomonadales bacterium]